MTGFTKFLAVSALLVCLLTGVVTMSFDKEIAFASQNADGVGVVSARGVWHRPDDTGTEKDVAGVCAFLDKLQRAGVNLVFLETFYHGMAMYRSALVPYYTKFQSYNYGEYADYMSCFVAEADKRGIEVHAWVENFYIGIEENYFTKNLPEWLLVTDKGSTRNTEGGGYIFLDPANAEVKNYYTSALIYLGTEEKWYPLSLYILNYIQSEPDALNPTLENIQKANIESAMIVVSILPILIIYPFVLKFFTKGVTVGSVKG